MFTYQHARRFAYRIGVAQGLLAVLPAPGVWIAFGRDAAVAYAVGGGAAALGTLVAVWWAFGRGQSAPGIGSMLVAEALKFTVVIAILALAMSRWMLPFGPLLIGLVVALAVYWIVGLKSAVATQISNWIEKGIRQNGF